VLGGGHRRCVINYRCIRSLELIVSFIVSYVQHSTVMYSTVQLCTI